MSNESSEYEGNPADAAISPLAVAPVEGPSPADGPKSVAAAPVPQPVTATLTSAAVFLVVTVNSGGDGRAAVRSLCGDVATL
jgi:hypothetical protein